MGIRCALIINLNLTDMERKTASISGWPKKTIINSGNSYKIAEYCGRGISVISSSCETYEDVWLEHYDLWYVLSDYSIYNPLICYLIKSEELEEPQILVGHLFEMSPAGFDLLNFIKAYMRACKLKGINMLRVTT